MQKKQRKTANVGILVNKVVVRYDLFRGGQELGGRCHGANVLTRLMTMF